MRLFEYVNQGGSIMYLLVLLNIFGMALLIWRLFVIWDHKKKKDTHAQKIIESLKELTQESVAPLELLKDQIKNYVHSLEYGLNTIKIIASIAPLLGLLGTVIGILSAFHVISQQGLSDPSLFAGGISMALVTTVGGLIVAIPHYIGFNYITGLLDNFEVELEKVIIPLVYSKKS